MKKRNNPVADERKKNLEKAKELPFKKRMLYYFDFFKIPASILLFFFIFVFFLIKDVILAKDTAITVTVVNQAVTPNTDVSEFIEPFIGYAGIDTKKETVLFTPDFYIDDTNPETIMKLVASVSAKDCDIIICNKEDFDLLASMSLLYDLSFYDNSFLKDKYDFVTEEYDHTKNDTADDDELGTVTYGIDISDSAVIKSSFINSDEQIILCIGNGSERTERTEAFISWLLD